MPSYSVPYAPQGQPFQPNFRLVDLLREQGADAADVQLRHGAITAQLANTLGQIPGQVLQVQKGEQDRKIAQQHIDLYDQTQAGMKAVSAAMANFVTTHPDGTKTLDPEKLPSFLQQLSGGDGQPAVPPAMIAEALKSLDDINSTVTKFQATKIDHQADLAHSLLQSALGKTPAGITVGIETAVSSGLASPQEAAALKEAVARAVAAGNDPADMLRTIRARSEKYKDLSKPVFAPRESPGFIDPSKGNDLIPIAGALPKPGSADRVAYDLQQELLAKQGGTAAPVAPLPGALPVAAGPSSLNAQTGQPILPQDAITGGSVNPIGPQVSPASQAMINTLPPGTPEPPPAPVAPPPLTPGEAGLKALEQITEAKTKATAGKALQRAQVYLDGKPAEVLFDPDPAAKQKVFDLEGKPITNAAGRVKPVPPASVVVNNQLASQFGTDAPENPVARAIAEYRVSPPSPRALATPSGIAILKAVQAINPDYDASKYANRAPTRKAFTTGPQGQQITALNTAIEHLDQLQAASDALSNGNFVPGNAAWNGVRAMFGNAAPTNYQAIKTLLNKEIEAVANKGIPITVAGTKEQQALAASSAGPKQIKGFIDTIIPLMGSKLTALTYQYKQAMGENDPFHPLTPQAEEILAGRGFDPNATTKAGASKAGSGGLVPTLRFNPVTGKTEPVK